MLRDACALMCAIGISVLSLSAKADDQVMQITGFTCTGWGAKNCHPDMVSGHLLIEPNAPAKAPLLVLVHTSSGINQEFLDEANGFAQQGFAVLYFDHFGPRKVLKSHYDYVAATAAGANVRTMSMDVLAALIAVKDDKRIDVNKAVVIGFSQGGLTGHWLSSATFIAAHKALLPREPIMPKAVIAMYSCPVEFSETAKSNNLPYHMVVGDQDSEYSHCQIYEKLNRAEGRSNVYLTALSGVYHTFDADYGVQNFGSAEDPTRCFAILHADGSATNPITRKNYPRYTYDQLAKDCMGRGQMAGNNGNRWVGAIKAAEIVKQVTGQ